MSDVEDALPVLDRAAAIDALGGDEELFETFIVLFIEDAAKQAADIESAIDHADAAGLERAAHSLKGAAGTMHAERVSAIARELEFVGKSGDLTESGAMLARLQTELESLRRQVQAG